MALENCKAYCRTAGSRAPFAGTAVAPCGRRRCGRRGETTGSDWIPEADGVVQGGGGEQAAVPTEGDAVHLQHMEMSPDVMVPFGEMYVEIPTQRKLESRCFTKGMLNRGCQREMCVQP